MELWIQKTQEHQRQATKGLDGVMIIEKKHKYTGEKPTGLFL